MNGTEEQKDIIKAKSNAQSMGNIIIRTRAVCESERGRTPAETDVHNSITVFHITALTKGGMIFGWIFNYAMGRVWSY
jgi:hypothetical protein